VLFWQKARANITQKECEKEKIAIGIKDYSIINDQEPDTEIDSNLRF